MISVLREVRTEFCEEGAYRKGVIIPVSWRAGKPPIVGGSEGSNLHRRGQGHARDRSLGSKGAEEEELSFWLFAWVRKAIGSIEQSRLGPGYVWSSSDLRF